MVEYRGDVEDRKRVFMLIEFTTDNESEDFSDVVDDLVTDFEGWGYEDYVTGSPVPVSVRKVTRENVLDIMDDVEEE